MSIEKLREIQQAIWDTEGEIHRVKNLLKQHPKKYKPRPGIPDDEEAKRAWNRIKFKLSQELVGLGAAIQRHHAAKRDLLNELSHEPVAMTTLEDTIERLVRIEAMFGGAPEDRIHEELTALIDRMEADAQRVRSLTGGTS